MRRLMGAFAIVILEVHGLSGVEHTGNLAENQGQAPTHSASVRRRIAVFLRRGLLLALLLLSGATLALAKDVALIANKGGSVSAITIPELVKLCKAQTNRWPDGKSVTLVMRDPGAPEMKMVLEKLYSMTPEAVNELIATANHGRMNHPAIIVVTSDDEIVKKVAGTPGAVGLVDVYAINSSVDVMKVAGKLPFEPGYPLHGN
jgi:hypothetical protein